MGRGRERVRERERRRRLGSLFLLNSSLHFETEMKLANLLKHWSVETRSGQETTEDWLFFNSHVPSVVTVHALPKPVVHHLVRWSSFCSCHFPQDWPFDSIIAIIPLAPS